VLKKVTKRREDINDTMFTEGDIAIAVQWYDRTDGDGDDGLSFEAWVDTEGDAGVQDIINSTELRAASSTPLTTGCTSPWRQRLPFSLHGSHQCQRQGGRARVRRQQSSQWQRRHQHVCTRCQRGLTSKSDAAVGWVDGACDCKLLLVAHVRGWGGVTIAY